MANTPPDRDSGSDIGEADGETAPGAPRWVKVFGIIAIVIVLLFLILMFTRGPGGRHGPGRHFSSGDTRATSPPSALSDRRAVLPLLRAMISLPSSAMFWPVVLPICTNPPPAGVTSLPPATSRAV